MEHTLKIPFVNLTRQNEPLKERLLDAVSRVMDHGQFIMGPEVTAFEDAFATKFGYRHAIGVNSGTDALVIALKSLGIGPGDEVITAANTYITTVSSIVQVGARAIFVDVGKDFNINAQQIERAITSKTKAILPIHLTGRPADMPAILAIANEHGLWVVEDCSQAVTATIHQKAVGSFGTIGCFSLHPLKTLNAYGDAGVIVTNDETLARHCRLLGSAGLETRDRCIEWGYNSRLDTIQAAMLLAKMGMVDCWTDERRQNAQVYRDKLGSIPGVTFPIDKPNEESTYHTFVIETDHRDGLQQHLTSRGIGTAIHYPVPIHLQEVMRDAAFPKGSLPVTEAQADRILSLPIYPELTPEDLDTVVSAIREFMEALKK